MCSVMFQMNLSKSLHLILADSFHVTGIIFYLKIAVGETEFEEIITLVEVIQLLSMDSEFTC